MWRFSLFISFETLCYFVSSKFVFVYLFRFSFAALAEVVVVVVFLCLVVIVVVVVVVVVARSASGVLHRNRPSVNIIGCLRVSDCLTFRQYKN